MIQKEPITALAVVCLAGSLLVGSWLVAEAHHPTSGSLAHEAERRKVRVSIPSFSLTDQKGEVFQFDSLRGKVVLLSFVYTTCPDVCSLVTISMSAVQREFTEQERKSVYLLSITTDPEVDTPGVLKSYTERHKLDLTHWSFLTGSDQELALVWKAFGITVVKKARGLVSHTSLTALVDRRGIVRFTYDGSAPDAKIVLEDLRSLLDLEQT